MTEKFINIYMIYTASEEKIGYTPVSPVRIRVYSNEFETLVAH